MSHTMLYILKILSNTSLYADTNTLLKLWPCRLSDYHKSSAELHKSLRTPNFGSTPLGEKLRLGAR
jgi:hypothetical protein